LRDWAAAKGRKLPKQLPNVSVRFPEAGAQKETGGFGQVTLRHLPSAYGAHPLRPRGDMLRKMRRVLFHPEDEARRPAGQKGQPQGIQPGHLSAAKPSSLW